jgi:hypothetical protein
VLFIGTQFSNLYTAVDTPAKGRVGKGERILLKGITGDTVNAERRVSAFCSKESLAILSTPSAQMWFFQ